MEFRNNGNIINIIYDIAQISSIDSIHAVTDVPLMCIGNNSSGYKFRVLLKFNLGHLPEKTQIISAALKLKVVNTASEFNQHKLSGYTLNTAWNPSSVNWNNQPTINYSNKVLEKSVRKGQIYYFDLTDQVIKWYETPSLNYGMVLICSEQFYASQIQIDTDNGTCENLSLELKYFIEQNIHVVVEPTQFFEYAEDIKATFGEYFTTIIDVSLSKTIAYFVKNNSLVPIKITIEYSPDKITFMKDYCTVTIEPNILDTIQPLFFGKYIRLSIAKPYDGNTNIISTWLEVQQ